MKFLIKILAIYVLISLVNLPAKAQSISNPKKCRTSNAIMSFTCKELITSADIVKVRTILSGKEGVLKVKIKAKGKRVTVVTGPGNPVCELEIREWLGEKGYSVADFQFANPALEKDCVEDDF